MKNYGLKLGKATEADYRWGTLPKTIINPSGDWSEYLPVYEPQVLPSGEDEYGCHIWGTENAIETLLKYITGISYNFSERFPYIGTNSDQSGGDPFQSCEWMRKNGFVDENVLPMTQTLAEFVQPKPLPQYLLDRGKLFFMQYSLYQEYVWNDYNSPITIGEKGRRITEALKLSPLGVSVPAWALDSNGFYYRPNGMQDNHWCVLFKETDKGYMIFDSYDQSMKLVRKDINFSIAVRYLITKGGLPKHSLWSRIIAWLKKLYELQ